MTVQETLQELKRQSRNHACEKFFLTEDGKILNKFEFEALSSFEKFSVIAFAEGEKIIFCPEI